MDMPTTTTDDDPPDVTIRTLSEVSDLQEAVTILGQVWGRSRPLVGVEQIPGAGHFLMLEAPEAFNAALEHALG
jgi:pimeloyl-ACP methyl ester carboxylesterase